jgi:prophage regulatory protein
MIAYTKLSRSAIYDRMNERSPRYDPIFPKKLSPGGGAIGWFKEDVDTWLKNCAEKADRGISHGEQLMSEMPMAVKSHPKSKSSASVTQSRPELRQPNEDFARIPAPHFSQSNFGHSTAQPWRANHKRHEDKFNHYPVFEYDNLDTGHGSYARVWHPGTVGLQ